jgi:hypothetical protein
MTTIGYSEGSDKVCQDVIRFCEAGKDKPEIQNIAREQILDAFLSHTFYYRGFRCLPEHDNKLGFDDTSYLCGANRQTIKKLLDIVTVVNDRNSSLKEKVKFLSLHLLLIPEGNERYFYDITTHKTNLSGINYPNGADCLGIKSEATNLLSCVVDLLNISIQTGECINFGNLNGYIYRAFTVSTLEYTISPQLKAEMDLINEALPKLEVAIKADKAYRMVGLLAVGRQDSNSTIYELPREIIGEILVNAAQI